MILLGLLTELFRWTAICQGAVMYGRTVRNLLRPPPVAVKARVARASYGLRLIVTWDGAKHLARDKCFDKHLLEWRADNQMEWCVVEVPDNAQDNRSRRSC